MNTCDHQVAFVDGPGGLTFSELLAEADMNNGQCDPNAAFYTYCPKCGIDLRKFIFYAVPHHKSCRPNPPETFCTCWKQEFRNQMAYEDHQKKVMDIVLSIG